jgi:hypothetical protein
MSLYGITGSEVSDLFDTTKPEVKKPAGPTFVKLSPEFRMQLVGRIQEIKLENQGYDPPEVNGPNLAKLKEAIAEGKVAEAKLSEGNFGKGLSVLIQKSDDPESASTFFYKRTGGYAGSQYFGPFDV